MHDLPTTVLWVYIILLLVGGLIGFLKAKSKVSLITSSIAAAVLILTTFRDVFQPRFANTLANAVMLVLLIVFAIRLTRTKKFMPSGMLLIVTIIALALRNIRF